MHEIQHHPFLRSSIGAVLVAVVAAVELASEHPEKVTRPCHGPMKILLGADRGIGTRTICSRLCYDVMFSRGSLKLHVVCD